MLGIIGGSSFFEKQLCNGGTFLTIKTSYGSVDILKTKKCYFLQRHTTKQLPPHNINYRANISALQKCGVTEIVAVNSCGALKKHLVPGSLVVPHDYINWYPQTFFDKKCEFITPELSHDLRQKILDACHKAGFPAHDGGVYFQAHGPRLETRAEINLIKNYADLVGMTMGTEAALAQEIGIKYASLCTVDNFAHGISEHKLNSQQIAAMQRKNSEKVKKIIVCLISK